MTKRNFRKTMKIDFLGDIFIKKKAGLSPDLKLENIVLNLEAPFSISKTPAKNKINLNMDPTVFFDTFANKNIIAANLSNNHIMDYGEEAFNNTLNILKSKDIKFFGAGKPENNYNNPAVVEDKTAFFGYTCRSVNGIYGGYENAGSAPFELESVLNDIEKFKGRYKLIINIHWGKDYHSFPRPEDVKIAHNLIDSGAELIIGHHPHVTQSVEVYKGKHIFYSIGNCIFDDLDQQAFFNGSEFTRTYKSRWKKRNRISIKAGYDTLSSKIDYNYLLYKNRELELYNGVFIRFKNKIILKEKVFKFYQMYLKRKFNIEHFFQDPKFPPFKKILKFLGVKR
jgi:hypothetical protein